jgi:hypothetical protein
VVTLALADSGSPKLLPRDEANDSFQAFRARTLEALARKDTAYLYGMLAPEIRNTFGGDDGIEGFRRIWNMDEPESPVWTALSRVLLMGGQQSSDSSFVAPYVFAFWPDSMDAFDYIAVVSDSARVYDGPSPDARTLGVAARSILRVSEWNGQPSSGGPGDSTLAQVQLPSGAGGWLHGADVYSPISWRAMFVRRAGQWLMILFVAGD